MSRPAKRARTVGAIPNVSPAYNPSRAQATNGIPIVHLKDLKPTFFPTAEYSASRAILNTALKRQRACILDTGGQFSLDLNYLMATHESLFTSRSVGDGVTNAPGKQLLRVCLQPDTKDNCATRALLALDFIGRICLGALANAMGLRQEAFLPLLDNLPLAKPSVSMLDVIKYLPIAQGGCEAHEDQGLLTLIYSPRSSGLQVQSSFGDWQSCVLQTNQVLILAGHILEYATCGQYMSAQHRVDAGQVIRDQGRVSLAYRLRADPDSVCDLKAAILRAGLPYRGGKYPQPISVRRLMERFTATHSSVNAAAPPLKIDQSTPRKKSKGAAQKKAPPAAKTQATPPWKSWVSVVTLAGKEIFVCLDSRGGIEAATVGDLAELIQDKEGYPPDLQRLIFDHAQLDHARLLSDCGVVHGSKMALILKLRSD